ncbi:MAG: hypothetical protein ACKV2O_23005 [Acidimicrobiales bacterium]
MGTTAEVPVAVRNTGRGALVVHFTWLGVAADAVTGLAFVELAAGECRRFVHHIALPAGMPPSCRQLALEVRENEDAPRVFPCEVAVRAPDEVRLWVARRTGRRRSRFDLHVSNRSDRALHVGLEARSEAPVRVGLDQAAVAVPAGAEVVVPGRVRTPRTSRTGRYWVEVRAIGAGTLSTTGFGCEAPSLFPAAGRKVLTLVGVVTVWAGLLGGVLVVTGKLGGRDAPDQTPPEQLARTEP